MWFLRSKKPEASKQNPGESRHGAPETEVDSHGVHRVHGNASGFSGDSAWTVMSLPLPLTHLQLCESNLNVFVSYPVSGSSVLIVGGRTATSAPSQHSASITSLRFSAILKQDTATDSTTVGFSFFLSIVCCLYWGIKRASLLNNIRPA